MTKAGTVALSVVVLLVLVLICRCAAGRRDKYSVGYQIGPHYLASSGSTWAGTPYALSLVKEGEPLPCQEGFGNGFRPFASPDDGPRGVTGRDSSAELVYTPPFTRDMHGTAPDWWTKDGGTFGLPPASDRPDFWAGDRTIHTYLARDVLPPLCEAAAVADHSRRPTKAEQVAKWRHYGGPRGWTMSPYY